MNFENYFLTQLELYKGYKDDKSQSPELRLKNEIIFNKLVDLYGEFKRLEYNFNCEK